jgi:hypothetical protein
MSKNEVNADVSHNGFGNVVDKFTTHRAKPPKPKDNVYFKVKV